MQAAYPSRGSGGLSFGPERDVYRMLSKKTVATWQSDRNPGEWRRMSSKCIAKDYGTKIMVITEVSYSKDLTR